VSETCPVSGPGSASAVLLGSLWGHYVEACYRSDYRGQPGFSSPGIDMLPEDCHARTGKCTPRNGPLVLLLHNEENDSDE
jgi:hypothetical protein